MKITEMIEVLQAAQRGEKIEFRFLHANVDAEWRTCNGKNFNFIDFNYRIALKKLSLVEELRVLGKTHPYATAAVVIMKAADRIEELENGLILWEHATDDELIDELKRRFCK